MAGKRMRCKKCRRQFTPLHRNRVNCYECRPARGAAAVLQFPPANRDEDAGQSVTELTMAELAKHSRLNTWQGKVAVRIAERIDAGSHTMAQDVKTLREQMSIALAGTEDAEPDEVDNVFSMT